ncbi:MAG: response regulator [Polaromonas sp.]|uniref:response regulator n=1 Tax=Polaromonas sp. TaxID=1869339 RepID=UPI00248A556C|nr:response regulator [Polaromonas sp.]MDI1270649.1 response regulator [Polaromonas sp.]
MALRIYLVEDNEVTCKHLMDALSAEIDIEWVGVAETEGEAKNWLERNPDGWDVAILDLFLREGTGAGVLRHCWPRGAEQDVLVMTNHPVSYLLTHCRLLGANAVFNKATELGDLIAYCIGRAYSPLQTRPQRLMG